MPVLKLGRNQLEIMGSDRSTRSTSNKLFLTLAAAGLAPLANAQFQFEIPQEFFGGGGFPGQQQQQVRIVSAFEWGWSYVFVIADCYYCEVMQSVQLRRFGVHAFWPVLFGVNRC
jgi:hypothetical protein